MTAKPPTPQGTSRLLAQAGFKRSERLSAYANTAGFRARAGRDTRVAPGTFVRVRWWPDSSYNPSDYREITKQRDGWLAKYAEVLSAGGWAVETKADCLIVTAGEGQ